ncbi:MAG: hypothetical protein HOQ11_00905 [Gemmatimonadaceae bacterium]|nr:hypothetical protein [Gemmatimonadaceae bacterium]NUQ92879.1 hypothetical protein [Gemmatimonadaceae bacterium]NUR18776.1 hypothetical protein [Gemmatimonadaceae bacterium]NUS95946.1 hypothetical protein [Gemmatimonadaceae bacterium]
MATTQPARAELRALAEYRLMRANVAHGAGVDPDCGVFVLPAEPRAPRSTTRSR